LVRDYAEYEKVVWFSSVPHQRGCFTKAWGRDEEHEPDEWLEIQNPREPEVPIVPTQCRDWVNPEALRNKTDLPELLGQITRQARNPDWHDGSDEPEIIPHIERLDEHPEVQQAWEQCLEDKWLPWTEEHNAWQDIHKVYSDLFAIYQKQLRSGEEYELVVGLGLLTWQTPAGQRIRRHLVVADASLEFEARLSKFTVRPHPEGAKLRPELDMLEEMQPPHAEENARVSLAAAEDDPWAKDCIEGVLQGLVHSINSKGEYEASLEAKSVVASEKPIVQYAPALILRKRSTKGLTEALKRIKQQIENGEAIPGEFADLAEIRPHSDRANGDGPDKANVVFDGEIFFPKPSNKQQRSIVQKLRGASSVLVQGPPGTGKSHTIANLICHLLATGQRTLITAKTPRALKVLEGLVPEELRPLCINLLGDGIEERKSLESSVGGILRKNEEWSEDRAKRERAELEERLRTLREEKARVDRRLRDIRESEIYPRSIADGAYQGTAARIAEAVNRDRPRYEWFADSVPKDEPCQNSADALRSVLQGLRQFPLGKRRELNLAWPVELPSPEQFADLVANETNAVEEEQSAALGADEELAASLARRNPSRIEAIRDAFSSFRDSRRRLLSAPHSWMNEALRDILGGNSTLWHERFRSTADAVASIEPFVKIADETRVDFPRTVEPPMLHNDARTLQEHMANGGKLGWGVFRPKPVKERLYVIKSVRVNGHVCATMEDFSTLANALHVRMECEKAWAVWQGRSHKVDGPYSYQLIALKSLRDALGNALALEERVVKCRELVNQCPGIDEPTWADDSAIKAVIGSCNLALARIRRQLATKEIQRVETPVARLIGKGDAHPITHDLLSAIRSRDVGKFAQCMDTIQSLSKQRAQLHELDDCLSKLRFCLPELTKALEETSNDPIWDERVLQIESAWHWAQAREWVEDYIRQEDVPALANRAKQIEDEISGIIAKLAALHAWSFCFSRLNEDHRRHMVLWQQSMRRLGKGTGKHAPRHRRDAREHLDKCREAVPAWVMPLHRVWDTVDPAPGMFDVIIVDEASQCGVEALPLLYLGRKILIVGDDKQISPDAVGVPRDEVHRLMEEFLKDFQYKSSFDIESSLFDHGKARCGTRWITLREHFRCMPEIIRFSNDLCYSDTPLIPLRQYGRNRLKPLDHVFVRDGYREGSDSNAINRPEAEAIVQRIAQMCRDSRYDGKTMGVVVLQGDAQAALIEGQLLERLGAEEMDRRRLLCGNPYSFQGDERDIVLLSLVAASNERIGSLTKPADERRFNVAASRARDQMILFHSVTCDDLGASDLRRRLLEFFTNTEPRQIAGIERDELERRAAEDNRWFAKPPAPFESWFEVDVALELLRKGFTVLPQYEFATKRIDLVVEGGQSRLAVECDGDSWHGADRYDEDMDRQRQLERCGWVFFRVRESAFYANRMRALDGLWKALEERGIFPASQHQAGGAEVGWRGHDRDAAASDDSDDADDLDDDTDDLLAGSESDFTASGRRADEITTEEIQDAILRALAKCPNRSCTLHSLTARVLKEVGVLTRGRPREDFERRTMRCVGILERRGRIEIYRAKNQRLRLLPRTLL
jgi:very-short-patch-repair endonuclease